MDTQQKDSLPFREWILRWAGCLGYLGCLQIFNGITMYEKRLRHLYPNKTEAVHF